MSGQNTVFTHAFVGEKSIRRFSIRPILTGHWNTLSRTVRQLLEQHSEPLSQSLILEITLWRVRDRPNRLSIQRRQHSAVGARMCLSGM